MQMRINGKRLHVEVTGEGNPSALLYLHGGPGGLGSLDFTATRGALLSRLWELGGLLGEKAGGILHGGSDPQFLNRIAYAAGLPNEVWANSARTRILILAEGTIYRSLIPRLKELALPALLLKGEHDPITCEQQVAATGSTASRARGSPLRCLISWPPAHREGVQSGPAALHSFFTSRAPPG